MSLRGFCLSFEHSAAGGNIDAAALAESAGEAGIPEDLLEFLAAVAGTAAVAAGGVEGDEIDVCVDALQQL